MIEEELHGVVLCRDDHCWFSGIEWSMGCHSLRASMFTPKITAR
ncbi:Protein of unknown function [Pyronema omphalodes CBS 100304]|uniref:Uncharacterized protein n=1 Tax=Pyronema omphalodes (strain CBS 100304) TaxID=1076935 RepID=U4LIV0_PYROM|nr:Protein of unknown function [Pyronema omphalodes CBS 100304]